MTDPETPACESCGGPRVMTRNLDHDTAFDCEDCGALLCFACFKDHTCPETKPEHWCPKHGLHDSWDYAYVPRYFHPTIACQCDGDRLDQNPPCHRTPIETDVVQAIEQRGYKKGYREGMADPCNEIRIEQRGYERGRAEERNLRRHDLWAVVGRINGLLTTPLIPEAVDILKRSVIRSAENLDRECESHESRIRAEGEAHTYRPNRTDFEMQRMVRAARKLEQAVVDP